MAKFIDLTGRKFGKLTALERVGYKGVYPTWLCECECGKRITVIGNNLRNGYTKSCGCTRRGKRKISTGVSMVRLRGIWRAMIGRCEHPQHPAYKYYGARGVRVCDDWKNEKAFIAWAFATGYNDSLTLDRVDNDGSYAPDNCRWADYKTQQRNRRDNVKFNGKTIPEWSEISGIKINTLWLRIKKGMTIEEAISAPIKK